MPDSDYSLDDDVSDDDYVGARAPANTRAAAPAKRQAKEEAPKSARKAWETEYSRTVEKTTVTVDADNLGQSVQEREEERKRKRLRKDTKPFQRGIIRHVVVVLDLSEAMMEKDMRPNRYYAMINYAQEYVREFFEQNPISQMSVLGMHDGICIRVSELSGNPAEHAAAILALRSKETGKEPKGAPSLQNALELARATLYHTPQHGTREVIVVFGSLLSLDPGDIHASVKACVRDGIRVSIIGMGARLKICTEIVARTNAGDESEYTIATDQEMLKELLIATTTPPAIRAAAPTTPSHHQQPQPASTTSAALMQMGFPSRSLSTVPTLCACHGNLTLGGYTCSRCTAKVCSLPVTCPSCALTLLLSTHLARSYHHLFPLRNWRAVSWRRASAKGSRECKGCLSAFPAVPASKERNRSGGDDGGGEGGDGGGDKDKEDDSDDDEAADPRASESARYECRACESHFCVDCDVFAHMVLHNCPGCLSRLDTRGVAAAATAVDGVERNGNGNGDVVMSG
jgi:transcription initiation factor TFIIH subunit 2